MPMMTGTMVTATATAMMPQLPAADSNNVDDNNGSDLRTPIGQRQVDDDNGTTTMYVGNDGNEDEGGDGDGNCNGDGDGDGDGNDAAAAADGNNVNEDISGDSRMTIG
jgi:hypothetical protein